MSSLSQRPVDPVVGQTIPHESAFLHVTGAALYTDDLVGRTAGVLHAWPVQSPHAKATVTALRVEAAYGVDGVVRVLTAADVPGVNDGGVKGDEPLFPKRSASSARPSAGCSPRPSRRPDSAQQPSRSTTRPPRRSSRCARRSRPTRSKAVSPRSSAVTSRAASPGRRTSSPASSTSPGRSTSTSRRTPPSPSSTRRGRCSSSRAPSTRARRSRSSPTCWGCQATR